MKKLFITIMLMLLSSVSVFAITDEEIIKEIPSDLEFD